MSSPKQQPPDLPVGDTLDRGFALLRRHARALLLPSLVLNLVPLVVTGVLVLLGIVLLGDVATHVEEVRESTILGDSELVRRDVADLTDGQSVVLGVLVALAVLTWACSFVAASAAVVRGTHRALDGEPPLGTSPAVHDALTVTPRLLGLWIVFLGLALAALLAVGAVVLGVAAVAGGLAAPAGAVAVSALLWAALRVGLWPFVHLGDGTGRSSFGRAWRMTRGRFWALVGVLLLALVVAAVALLAAGLVVQAAVLGPADLGGVPGIVALVPYAVFATLLAIVLTAVLVTPLAIAARTLSGRDADGSPADAEGLRPDGATGPALARPAPEPGVRRWDGGTGART